MPTDPTDHPHLGLSPSPIRTATLAAIGLAAGASLAGCAATAAAPISPAPATTAGPTSPAPAITATVTATAGTAQGRYRDGDYEATGWYGNLPSHIVVDVTIGDDTITAVTVTPTATDPTSLGLQERFADAVPGVVVGVPLDEVHVDRLAGSSGTPVGFNDAIDQIKQQAARD